MARLERQSTVYKELWLEQVLKSKENVQSVQNVFESEYLNPGGLMEELSKPFHLINFGCINFHIIF